MKLNFFYKLLLGVFLVLTGTIAAFPCKCVPASLSKYYRRADAVVTAKVISVSTDSEQITTAQLEISQVWKKDLPKQIEVMTGSSCAYNFQVNEKHLLYLQSRSSGQFSTMKCQGNLPLDKSLKSQNWLKKYGKKANTGVSSILLPDYFADSLNNLFFEVDDSLGMQKSDSICY